MDVPETKYARSGDSYIAYKVFGEGPIDVLNCRGFASSIDMIWDSATFAVRFFTRLAFFARVIVFDRRGSGASESRAPESNSTTEVSTSSMACRAGGVWMR